MACSSAEEVRLQVHRQHTVPLLLGDLRPGAAGIDHRVVDEDVDSTEFSGGAADCLRDRTALGHVKCECQCAPTLITDACSDPFGPLPLDIRARDGGAGRGERCADALAESAAGSGYERDPSVQPKRISIHSMPVSARTSASDTARPS